MTANTAKKQRQELDRLKATLCALQTARATMPAAITSVSGVNSALDDWDETLEALVAKAENAIRIMEDANA